MKFIVEFPIGNEDISRVASNVNNLAAISGTILDNGIEDIKCQMSVKQTRGGKPGEDRKIVLFNVKEELSFKGGYQTR